MRNIFLILTAIFACLSGCYIESDSDKSEPLFTAPVEINQPNETTLTPNQSTVEPQPAINTAQPDNKDLTAPKLVESTVDNGRIPSHVEMISLRFNEDIVELDIKLLDALGESMGWIPSIDAITGRRIFLNRLKGRWFGGAGRRYHIKGSVEDRAGNETPVDIEFRAF